MGKATILCGQADTQGQQQALWAVNLCHGLQQQYSLTPGCIDLVPLHRSVSSAAQAEAANGAKGAIMPDSKDIMVHICLLQSLQVGSAVLHLQQHSICVVRLLVRDNNKNTACTGVQQKQCLSIP